MVFTSLALFIRSRGPDEFWRKRKILKLAAHFVGRRRNCYSIAIRSVHRALAFSTKGRRQKKLDMAELWNTRLAAACEEHSFTSPLLREGLARSEILLNRKSLVDLAIWEPRTFEGLTKIAWQRCIQDGLISESDYPVSLPPIKKI
ncbi:39S ribosomal protein L20, mitochondrial [Ischnura elegans]|uniref:39S ribosomal protein L20, mitochondrial n=1 Tax=Ischnura elegans TaxID=197161 RepID=UPI001ED89F07|nr:39S ribosomal protein L20, mitochondrial [Ischnura elegans]